jgi:hypothetical protein
VPLKHTWKHALVFTTLKHALVFTTFVVVLSSILARRILAKRFLLRINPQVPYVSTVAAPTVDASENKDGARVVGHDSF